MVYSYAARFPLLSFARQHQPLNKHLKTAARLRTFASSTAPVTELVRLQLRDQVYPDIDDPNTATGRIWNNLFQPLLHFDGCQYHFWGRQVENPNVATIFVGWDSIERHTSFMKTSNFEPMVSQVSQLTVGPPSIIHIPFQPYPPIRTFTVTTNQVTEVTIMYFRKDYKLAEQKNFHGEMTRLGNVWKSDATGFKSIAGGWVIEEIDMPNANDKYKAYISLVGWESMNAAIEYRSRRALEDSIRHFTDSRDLPKVDVFHVEARQLVKSARPS